MKKIGVFFVALIALLLSACSENEIKEDVTFDDGDATAENIGFEIESALTKIIDAPSASSNPNDYVRANRDEFDYIVGQGSKALNYMMNKFSKSNNGGLKEYVMAMACAEILGDLNPVKEWETGKEWYDSYKNI